jgi:uncharacterized OB-fold protein
MNMETKPLPVITSDNREYWDFCKRHELRVQKCRECGHQRFPPSFLCPKCHSTNADWVALSGKGEVYSYVVFRVPYHPSYVDDIPYTVAFIKLAEGPRMESNLTGIAPEEVRVGMAVEVYFDDVSDNISLPKFRPVP